MIRNNWKTTKRELVIFDPLFSKLILPPPDPRPPRALTPTIRDVQNPHVY